MPMIHLRFLLGGALLLLSPPATLARTPAHQAATIFDTGMVSAADPRAAAAGVEILRTGGNATDAAIAVMLALGVVEPQSSGLGGGGFMIHGDAQGHVDSFDGREFAPSATGPGWWLSDGQPMPFSAAQPGGKSVGVPGSVALIAAAHTKYGHLAWAKLFQPAIRLAHDGFVVTPRLHTSLTTSAATGAFSDYGRKLFYTAEGQPVAAGTRVHNPALATFLARLAARGPQAFYHGENAAALTEVVNHATHNPSPLRQDDLTAYAAIEREPLCGEYREWRICGMGPPSSGATTVFAILKQLERFDLSALGKDSPVSWHLIAESMRLAYADRDRYLGDPGFVTVPMKGLMNPTYLASRSALIDPSHTLLHVNAGTPPGAEFLTHSGSPSGEEHGTTHFVVVDRSGETVSYTNTIESAFGSGLVVNGYFLNNELTDFNFVPDINGQLTANAAGPHKRPRSSIAPTLVYDPAGHLRLAIGAAGGATIPAQVAKAIIAVLDWHLPAREAIALPVLFAPGGDTVFLEKGSTHEALVEPLRTLGHTVQLRSASFKANAVEVINGKLFGAADPRSEGAAITP